MRCSTEAVARHRREKKTIILAEKGGSCQICGYDRYLGALELHHRDPSVKEFEFGQKNWASSLDKLRIEANKCDLLCANCHREVEAGLVTVPNEQHVGESPAQMNGKA